MSVRPIALLTALWLLTGCWIDDEFEEHDLTVTPFGNSYIERGTATLEVRLAEGYTCPDGRTARIYYVDPVGIDGPRPLAVLYHGRAFDYIDGAGQHYEGTDRLNSPWAASRVQAMLGLTVEQDAASPGEGAWVAALLEAGWSVAAPTDCWGDLWHGRGGNDLVQESFLRMGSYLADDTIRLARERDGVSTQRVVAIGLGEGGRAIAEMIGDGVHLDAVVVDSSPDWLAPVVVDTVANQDYVAGLLRIWDDDVADVVDPDAQLEALRAALRRDSLVHAVEDLGFRQPIVYGWSQQDERIDPATSRPAAEAIGAAYPVGDYQVLDWQVAAHAPSNRDLAQTRDLLAWISSRLGPLPPEPDLPGDDDDSAL
jgi:hypothetical protein